MPNNCPVQIQYVFKEDVGKYQVTKVELEHNDHPVSEEHVTATLEKSGYDYFWIYVILI
jgi:hypothetical protein